MIKTKQILLILLTLIFTHQSMAAACVNCETDTSSSVHEGHDMDAMPDNDSMNCDTNIDLCSMVFCVGVSIVSSSFDCLAVNASNDLPRFNSFSLLSLAPTVIYHPPIS